MKFEEALVELRKDKKIRNKIWRSNLYISLEKKFNTHFDYNFIYEDWEVLEEPGKTFPEVFEAFKEGKSIRRKEWLKYDETKNMYFQISDFYTKLTSQDLLETDWETIE